MYLVFKEAIFILIFITKGSRGENSLYILLYVDNMLLVNHDINEIELSKNKLKSEFEMEDLDPVRKIIGIEIKINKREGTLILCQQSYGLKLQEKISMSDCKSVSLPLTNHFKLSNGQYPKSERRVQENGKSDIF